MIASAFFLLVAGGLIVLVLIYQRKQFQFVLEKKELSNQFQKELLTTRLEAQEETLNQLSIELHDNVGQLLSSSKLLIGVSMRGVDTPAEELQLAEQTVSKAIVELRAMSKSLNKDWLEKFSFIDNLRVEVQRINATKEFAMTFQHPSHVDLPSDRQLVLFRIVQEAFQNALKHSQASEIKIKMEQNESFLNVAVQDNGQGFELNDSLKSGMGINNIKNRTQLLGGTVSWNSTLPGTNVMIQIPLTRNSA